MSHDQICVPLIETCMDWNTTLSTRCGPDKQQQLFKSNFITGVQNSGTRGRAYYMSFYMLEIRENVHDFCYSLDWYFLMAVFGGCIFEISSSSCHTGNTLNKNVLQLSQFSTWIYNVILCTIAVQIQDFPRLHLPHPLYIFQWIDFKYLFLRAHRREEARHLLPLLHL